MILLLLATKKASAATTNTVLPTDSTQRPPERGVNLGATGARLCCGTAAPVVPGIAPAVISPAVMPGPAVRAPSYAPPRGAIFSTAPPISQIAPVVRNITYTPGPSAATPAAAAPPRLTYNTFWQEVGRRQALAANKL